MVVESEMTKKMFVNCHVCGKIIESEADINILLRMFKLKIYCNNCYSSLERSFERYFLYSKIPINSVMYISGTWFMTSCFIIGLILIPFYPALNIPQDVRISAIFIGIPLCLVIVYLMWKVHFNAQKIIKRINVNTKK